MILVHKAMVQIHNDIKWTHASCYEELAIGLAGEFGVSDPKYSSVVDRRWGASPLVDQLVVDTCCKNPQFKS